MKNSLAVAEEAGVVRVVAKVAPGLWSFAETVGKPFAIPRLPDNKRLVEPNWLRRTPGPAASGSQNARTPDSRICAPGFSLLLGPENPGVVRTISCGPVCPAGGD
jgi:hypothetical protein